MDSASTSTPGPLNPGNVVSVAIRLYRDRFSTYVKLAAQAILWIFVPIYGWAQYSMYTGIMSRLAYQDLINQPETPKQARNQVKPRLWSFFGLGFLLALTFIGAYLGLAIAGVIAGVVVGGGLGFLLSTAVGSAGVVVGSIVSAVLVIGIVVLGLLWIVGRLLIPEVVLAVEPDTGASKSIGRSWELTKSSIVRIQFVVLAAYLVTLPIAIVAGIVPQIFLFTLEPGSAAYQTLYIVTLVISLLSNLVTVPFWQTVKGVLYYDVRSRREGVDLKISSSDGPQERLR